MQVPLPPDPMSGIRTQGSGADQSVVLVLVQAGAYHRSAAATLASLTSAPAVACAAAEAVAWLTAGETREGDEAGCLVGSL